jgi:hypothetical protein
MLWGKAVWGCVGWRELVEMSVEMRECEVIDIVKLFNPGKGSQKQRQAQRSACMHRIFHACA